MSDQILESGSSTSAETTGATSGQQTSNDQPAFSATQLSQLEKLVEKQWQSGKDRRIDKLQKDVGSLNERYFQLRQTGMSAEEANRQLVIDEIVAERTAPTKGESNPQTPPVELKTTKLFEVLGINPTDQTALDIAIKHGNNPAKLKEALVDYKLSAPPPQSLVPGAVIAPASGTTTPADDNAKAEQLISEQRRLQLDPIKNKVRLGEIRVALGQLTPQK